MLTYVNWLPLMSLEILDSVLSWQYGICGDVFRLFPVCFDSSFLPLSPPGQKTQQPHHKTTCNHSWKKSPLGIFWCWWSVWRMKKNHSLESGWFLELSLRREIWADVHVCIYGKKRLQMCQEWPPAPASDTFSWRGQRARQRQCAGMPHSSHKLTLKWL